MSESLKDNRVIHFLPDDDPHGWIQWKGTDVCVDIRCSCGGVSHYDGDFMYYIQCPHCNKFYEVNGHIELIEVSKKEAEENSYVVKIPEIM